jgi:hypothetical protein
MQSIPYGEGSAVSIHNMSPALGFAAVLNVSSHLWVGELKTCLSNVDL